MITPNEPDPLMREFNEIVEAWDAQSYYVNDRADVQQIHDTIAEMDFGLEYGPVPHFARLCRSIGYHIVTHPRRFTGVR